MTKLILSGCLGRMGRVITSLCENNEQLSIVAGIDPVGSAAALPYPVFSTPEECNVEADVLVDFSAPAALGALLAWAKARSLPLVLASTGYSPEQLEQIEADSKQVPIFRSANLSLGVNLLLELTKRAAQVLGEDFDMFILDLMLPGVDGFEICKRIRENKNTPILMVSAKKDDIDKIRGLGLGADDYITKPFSPSELVARVKAHLSRYERLINSNVQENDVIEIRGLKIDKTARRVWVNDEEKQFTTKEFDLLAFLAQNPNRVFSKEELFSEIWDLESVGDIATVTVHIKKIREKIEYNTTKPQYIETIWGVGYRFKV